MNYQKFVNILAKQKSDLGMSESYIAQRAGLSQSTVHRIFTGHHDQASWNNLVEIGKVLGVELQGVHITSARKMLDAQANMLAEVMTGMVQATSQLEGQGLNKNIRKNFVEQTKNELLSGSRRKLWLEK